MAKGNIEEFFTEREGEDVKSFSGASIRHVHGRFGMVDKYGGRAAVENRNGITLKVNELGKWEEEDSTSTVYFSDLETFAAWAGRAVQFLANEQNQEWPLLYADGLASAAASRIQERDDAPVIKFRNGQEGAKAWATTNLKTWEELQPSEKQEWRRRYEAAKRDIQ